MIEQIFAAVEIEVEGSGDSLTVKYKGVERFLLQHSTTPRGPKHRGAINHWNVYDLQKKKDRNFKMGQSKNEAISFCKKLLRKEETAGSYTDDTLTRQEAETLAKLVAPFIKRLAKRFHIAGSYRRGKTAIGDLDFITTECDLGKLMGLLTEKMGAKAAPRAGQSVLTMLIPFNKKLIQVEFVNVKDNAYGAALLHSTGSGDFNMGLRSWVKAKGLLLSQHGLFDATSKKWLAGATEEDIFRYVGLDPIPPQKRNGAFNEVRLSYTFDSTKGASPHMNKKPAAPKAGVKTWKVKSKTTGDYYLVTRDASGKWFCPCEGFKWRHNCRHVKFVKDKIGEKSSVVTANYKCRELPPKVADAFFKLGDDQRGAPEEAMIKVTHFFSGPASIIFEHCGDLTWRMSHHAKWNINQGNMDMDWKNKIEKCLYYLRDRPHNLSFEDEFQVNCTNNAKYHKVSVEDYKAKFWALAKAYADAHSKLIVYNECQWHARQAAVQFGKWNTDLTKWYLEWLEKLFQKGYQAAYDAAYEYKLDGAGNPIPYKHS